MDVKTKLFALLLALAMLLGMAGCTSAPKVMQYDGAAVTANMYRYWLSTYKGSFMNTYTDMRDTDAFWDSAVFGDVKADRYLTDAIITNVKRTLVCAAHFDSLGLKFPETAAAEIDAYIEDLIENRADGSRRSFNQALAQYGINIDMLRQIYIMEDKTELLFTHLYGTGGAHALSAEDYEAYCGSHYVRIRHIYVNNAYAYETDENGHYSYDSSGVLKTRSLTPAEIAEKAKKIADIDAALAAGKSFDSVYETYSEDLYYKNGYYLSATTNFIPDVITAAFALEVGGTARVESDYGTHYIMRLEMDERPYENKDNEDFFASFEADAKNDHFLAWLDTLLPQVTVDEEELAKYSIRDASPNYSI